MYFYADRTDRNGNRLLTSYGKEAQARKYGGADARLSSGERRLTIRDDGSAVLSKEGDGLLVRTLMVKPEGAMPRSDGKFVVFARMDGKWERTPFRYGTYSMANQAVKSALINLYEACAVIEMEAEDDLPVSAPLPEDDSAPFDL